MSVKQGDKVENFILKNSEGKDVSLADLIKNKKTLLLFIPLAFSGVCTEEVCKTRDNMKMYNSLNVNVVGISVDSFFTLREFKKQNNLNFDLLSDFNKEVSDKFGVLYDEFYGLRGVSKRAAFIVNSDRRVEYAEVLEDADQLPDFKKIITVLAK